MEKVDTAFSLFELFRLGGVFMWPLLFFSVAAIAITLDRVLFLSRYNLRIDKLAPLMMQSLKVGHITDTEDYLKQRAARNMGARVLLALVRHASLPEARLEKAVESEAKDCITALEAGFTFLAAIGSLAPLTGFLGTVSGMIGAFRSIAEATEVNAQIVANGIYEALITTVFGLIIAIIAMFAHYLLVSVVDRFAVRTEKVCSDVITEMAVQNKKESEAALPYTL